MRGLKGKVALVTGGGGGIGRALCRRFAEESAIVFVLDREGAAAASVARELGGDAKGVHPITVDISSYQDVVRAVGEIENSIAPDAIHILVNNAGFDRFGYFLDTEPDLWDQLIAVNLVGHLNMHHVVLKGMQQRRAGRVINIASDAGRVGSSMEAVYSACKGGIIAFSKTMAREMARTGVTINVVCPGPTETPLLQGFLAGEQGRKVYEGLKRAIPLGRLGQPDDLPGLVAFLASDDAKFMTGQVISVSGGLTMSG